MKINLISRLRNRYNRLSNENYIKHLRSLGMEIGRRTVFFRPSTAIVDETRPWLIKIGDDVKISEGITILSHGFDWSVLKKKYGEVLGSAGMVTINDNVFIGMNVTILKGVTIGKNVIIGAGSVVTRDIPDNTVAAGNPARVIMTLEEYYNKRKSKQTEEAKVLVDRYREVYKKEPTERELSEFFFLFESGEGELNKYYNRQLSIGGNREESLKILKSTAKPFANKEDFLGKI